MALFEHAVALTGGIATGKSTAAKIFENWDVESIDLDRIAHSVLETKQTEIAALFGEKCVTTCGIDRKVLGKIVFADEGKRKRLEALVHPDIRKKVETEACLLDQKGSPYLIDIPLFFELESYPLTRIIVVYAPQAIQLGRIMKRDNICQEEAMQRIGAQIHIEEKKRKADYVIDNSGDLAGLEQECQRVYDLIWV